MVKFAGKLELLIQKLCRWNKEAFDNIHQTAKETEVEVIKLEASYDSSPTESNKKNLCLAQQKLNEKLEIEESYWKQKSKCEAVG